MAEDKKEKVVIVSLVDGSSEVVIQGKRITGTSTMTLNYDKEVKRACNVGVLKYRGEHIEKESKKPNKRLPKARKTLVNNTPEK